MFVVRNHALLHTQQLIDYSGEKKETNPIRRLVMYLLLRRVN